ncbi:carboxylate-amine ligase [Streptomyces sp. URMC 123]|uniref:carboxylate-amine ligase n=1 Tax=Streptomyces sp. URMC 123 TaxID=3423403 RepID=UPI003F1D1808
MAATGGQRPRAPDASPAPGPVPVRPAPRPADIAPAPRPAPVPPAPRLGVEEEYFLVDPRTGALAALGSKVLQRARRALGDLVSGEFTEYQIEGKTPPCGTLGEVYRHIARMRTEVSAAAAAEGLHLLASGTPITAAPEPAPFRDDPRLRVGADLYRALNDEHTVCAFHTHVEVPDREHAVLVGNHLRPWLPTLAALAANSPFWHGRDSGYASWRTIVTGRWPIAGPPPYLAHAEEYDRLVGVLRRTGTTLDDGTLFWDVRPCAHLPTVEVRVMDVVSDARDAAVLAVLVRALVVTALARVRDGDPGPRVCDTLLRAAYWRAARDGCSGHGIDLRDGRLLPAAEAARRLLDHTAPVLRAYGELAHVAAVLRRPGAHGGAERQRRALARRGSLRDVVDRVREATVYVPEPWP